MDLTWREFRQPLGQNPKLQHAKLLRYVENSNSRFMGAKPVRFQENFGLVVNSPLLNTTPPLHLILSVVNLHLLKLLSA
jgi:hypothetical protein